MTTAMIPLTRGLRTLVDEDIAEILGQFKWLAQTTSNGVYAARADYRSGRRYVLLHREITACPPDLVVDHINHDTLDNRRCNLRVCQPFQNAANTRKQLGTKLSRFKGVAFVPYLNRKNPWMAFINLRGKRRYLGYWPDEETAARVRDDAAIQLHGAFAQLNLA